MKDLDYLVAGQGLAGTIFALTAISRGRNVLVIDPAEEQTCSRIAAGLMNPITGPRFALGKQEADHWDAAVRFYREWEARLGLPFFEERPILRLFTGAEQAERWSLRAAHPDHHGWHAPLPEDWDASPYRFGPGGFTTRRCGRLDTRAFLSGARSWLESNGCFRTGRIVPEDGGRGTTVWCLGHASRQVGPFRDVPVRPARGSILTIRIPGLREGRILHAGKWIVPVGEGLFRFGSTYEWNPADAEPSPAARAELAAFLDGFLRGPWEWVREEAGIRPMANRGRPFLGRHPERPGEVLFNGLGSRGATLAPWHAARLLDHLEADVPLDPEVDAARWLRL